MAKHLNPPEECDICKSSIGDQGRFVDGRTKGGPWANMCMDCFATHGVGLGLGRGQRYDWDGHHYLKTGG